MVGRSSRLDARGDVGKPAASCATRASHCACKLILASRRGTGHRRRAGNPLAMVVSVLDHLSKRHGIIITADRPDAASVQQSLAAELARSRLDGAQARGAPLRVAAISQRSADLVMTVSSPNAPRRFCCRATPKPESRLPRAVSVRGRPEPEPGLRARLRADAGRDRPPPDRR